MYHRYKEIHRIPAKSQHMYLQNITNMPEAKLLAI
jgi:hypothetical protein